MSRYFFIETKLFHRVLVCSRKLKEVIDEGVEEGVNDNVDMGSSESEGSDTELVTVDVRPEEKWDCESILSTYSNLYNHPRLIPEPKLVSLE